MREIIFNGFLSNSVLNQSQGLWRHPQDTSTRYLDMDYWLDMARTAERGLFDGLFFADQLGYFDVFDGSAAMVIEHGGLALPQNDPLPVIAAMATVTEHLCFGMTASTAAEHPYAFARRMSTLDHLTKGRIGWNIVTSYLKSAARNLGDEGLRDHDLRYEMADEYMEVCYKLWEGSWEDGARASAGNRDFYADPTKVHAIAHRGNFYSSAGVHMAEPSLQRTPFLFQAGTSNRGIQFAARHAEAVFTVQPTAALLKQTATHLRDAVEAAGRPRDALKILNLAMVVVSETDESAQREFAEYEQYADVEGALAYMSGLVNVDFSVYPLDQPLDRVELNDAIHGFLQLMGHQDQRHLTLRQLVRFWAFGTTSPIFIGSPRTVAQQMIQWCEDTDTDGFNLGRIVHPGTFDSIADLLVPELQQMGAYKREYRPGTMREKFSLGNDGPRLPSTHAAASFRSLNRPVRRA